MLRKMGLLVSVVFLSILSSGCNDNKSNDISPAPPIEEKRATITTDNIDAILATSVSGVDKIASLVDGLVEKLPIVKLRNRGILNIDLTTRDCADSGSISVDRVTTSGGTLNFSECQENGYLLNGAVTIDTDGTYYDATFKDFSASDNTNSITLADAAAHIVGDDYNFFIATGVATVNGNPIEVRNFTLEKTGQQATVNGSLKNGCVGAWIDITTEKPLQYDENNNLIGGQLYIIGDNSDISILINEDGSVTVLLNGSLYQNYSSVDELPQYSEYCQ